MKFEITARDQDSQARTGFIETTRGKISTPVFMPVGTLGNVKTIHQRELERDIQAEVILGNAYHLYLRPGTETISSAGGLHRFIGWNRHILTDSGGYQIYSLALNRKISDDGVKFQSHIDGSKHFISPEKAVEIQRMIGADFIMAFDECTSWPADVFVAEKSMKLTHQWLDRCLKAFDDTIPLYGHTQYLLPIVQGSTYPELRRESAQYISEKNCMANAIGGLSVGEPAELRNEMTELVCSILPEYRPRYLMGVGKPEDILDAVSLGVDMFDCVIPTRNARHGILYTMEGVINIKNEKWKHDFTPVNQPALSFIDEYYSKSYIRHLFISGEILALQIASLNNLVFYFSLMEEIRQHIQAGNFSSWSKEMKEKLSRRL